MSGASEAGFEETAVFGEGGERGEAIKLRAEGGEDAVVHGGDVGLRGGGGRWREGGVE